MSEPAARDGLGDAHQHDAGDLPPHRLWWRSPAERNHKLVAWRGAVMVFFGEQSRLLRVAWALDGLFNVKTGYAHPSNTWLSKVTGISINKVQQALAELEDGGAIVRVVKRSRSGTGRMIYPAATLVMGTPRVGVGGPPAAGGTKSEYYPTPSQTQANHPGLRPPQRRAARPPRRASGPAAGAWQANERP